MKTKSSNLIQNFYAVPSPATWDCVGKSLKIKTKSSNLSLYKKISKNENQVQQLDSNFLRSPKSSNLRLCRKIS